MNSLIPFIWAAGVLQFGLAGASFSIRAKLDYRANVARMSPIMQQVSIVHWAFIAGFLLAFSGLCFFFAPQLVGKTPLGRFLSALLATFWLARLAIQLFYFDKTLRGQNRFADAMFLLAFFFMAATFTAATLGGLQ